MALKDLGTEPPKFLWWFVGVVAVLYVGSRLFGRAEDAKPEVKKPASIAVEPAVPSAPVVSYEQSVRDAWKEANESNREVDREMGKMIERYKKKSVSWSTSSSSGSRVDTFHMKDGSVAFCRTTVNNGINLTVSIKSWHYMHLFIHPMRNDGCKRTV